ncbi:MAG: DUF1015 domain-containing protein [Deltaproteobacteria bacterium]|nr:DUF1015 domain-containing protein [Deltaproteobacteria bacterium]
MAEILPLRGYIYNSKKAGDMSKVMSPPYDVISPEFQETLYQRHSYNIVRLEFGKTSADDTSENNRYSRSKKDFEDWKEKNIIERDAQPAIYYYTQTYKLKSGETKTRKGFIALAKLEDFGSGKIHPHERTLAGPKADRLNLMKTCKANFSCIFSLYSEPKKEINKILETNAKGTPIIDAQDDDSVINRMWRIDNPEIIKDVMERMKDNALFIADGHHRYETALNYRNMMIEQSKNWTGREAFNYVMMYFSNMDDEGMTIFPTHRIIHSVPDFISNAFLVNCSNFFDIHEIKFNDEKEPEIRKAFYERFKEMEKEPVSSFGLAIKGMNSYFILKLKSKDIMEQVFGNTIPDVFKSLDVTVLHSLILNKILGLSQKSQENQENLVYVKDTDEALNTLKNGNNQIVFLLHPTKIGQVKAVAKAGHVMPQKSTYFYPKLATGIVINSVEESEIVAAI